MTRPIRYVVDRLDSNLVTLVGTLVSTVALILAIYSEFPRAFLILAEGLGVAIFSVALLYSIRVRERALALQGSARQLHEINHTYRDVLTKVFDRRPPLSTDERMKVEQDTLETVCQRIAVLYTALIARHCTVTVKIVTNEESHWLCRTYARSELHSRRDQAKLVCFALGTGENTAFDTAMAPRPGGGVSRFFAGDLVPLKKKGEYRNQRDDFERYYRSAIVVPIRYLDYEKLGCGEPPRPTGFLCVDTLSANYLNDGYHVEFLAAFADQMYNFLSLMRGKYRLPRNRRS